MPFESGSTALMVCRLNESMPGDFLERLAKYTELFYNDSIKIF